MSFTRKKEFEEKKEQLTELLARGLTTREISAILCEKCYTIDKWRAMLKKL